jgi:uncharacterized protein
MNTIWLAFITGLTTGGISCLAVQGGLLASAISGGDGQGKPVKFLHKEIPVLSFLAAKLLIYTFAGGLLGLLGSALTFSPKILGVSQIIAGVFMLLTAFRILDIHPIFRYFVINPPRFIFRYIRNISREQNIFTPAILGFLTIFIPCGVTQAMMVFAATSGNALSGALILGSFVLGTSPVFLVLGAVVVELLKKKVFAFAAAALIIIMSLISINGGMVASGSIYTFQNLYKAATTVDVKSQTNSENGQAPVGADGKQEVTITVGPHGYESDFKTLKVGVPVRLTLKTKDVRSCARAFTIPKFNIAKVLPESGEEVIEFTPDKIGDLSYSCSMGMYTGSFDVK